MPLYEYQCQSCGERTEVIQNLSDAPLAECPKCNGPVKKLLSAPAIQFKGSGFYKTDYASSSSSPSSSSSSNASTPSTSTDSSPATAAPAAKTESKSNDTKSGD